MAETPQAQPGMIQKAGTFMKNQAAFGTQKLLTDGIASRLGISGKLLGASQFGYSSVLLIKESLNGSTWAQIVSSLKDSLFLVDYVGKPLVQDGGNHAAAWAMGVAMAPSLIKGAYTDYKNNVDGLVAQRNAKNKALGDHGELAGEPYKANAFDKARMAVATFLDKIPTLFLTAYTITVATKTDVATAWTALDNHFSSLKGDEGQKVMDALSSMPVQVWGTALGVYGLWKSGNMGWTYVKNMYNQWETDKAKKEFTAAKQAEVKKAPAKHPAEAAAAAEFDARLGDGAPPAEAPSSQPVEQTEAPTAATAKTGKIAKLNTMLKAFTTRIRKRKPAEEAPAAGPQVAVNTHVEVNQTVKAAGVEKAEKAPKTTKPRKPAGKRITVPAGMKVIFEPVDAGKKEDGTQK